jgi:hypothetical protein
MCREVARGAGRAAVRWLRADSPGSNRAARGERRRPSRRRQRMKSGGTADCSWRVWRWPGASRPRSSRRRRSAYGAASWKEKLWSEGGGRA